MERILQFFSPDRARLITFVSFLASVPSFLICRTHHFCVYGHFHEETTSLGYANDYFWQAGFGVALLLCFRCDITFRYAFIFAMSVGFLWVASPLNLCGVLIYPVTAAAGLFALASLIGWID
jgi:hypothetical protein